MSDATLEKKTLKCEASNLPHACHGSAYFLGGKKSLLVLDRFLYSFTASNLPHACHLSSKFLGGRNASVLLTDSLPAGKGEAQGVFSCQHQNFFPTLGFLLSFLKKQKCLTLPQGFHPEDYPQAKNMLLFLVSWVPAGILPTNQKPENHLLETY